MLRTADNPGNCMYIKVRLNDSCWSEVFFQRWQRWFCQTDWETRGGCEFSKCKKQPNEPVVDQVVDLQPHDGVVDAEVGAWGERNDPKIQCETGLLDLADELRQLRVCPGAIENLKWSLNWGFNIIILRLMKVSLLAVQWSQSRLWTEKSWFNFKTFSQDNRLLNNLFGVIPFCKRNGKNIKILTMLLLLT